MARCKALQRPARLEPQLLPQPRSQGAVDLQRIRLPSGAVERQHQLPLQTLLKRVLSGECLELRHELARTPQCELGVEPIHADSQPQLLETPDLRLCEVEQSNLLQRRATPQPERLGKRGARALALTRRAESAALLGEPLEAQAVQLLRIDVQEITAGASLEDPVTQTAPQPRDRHLKRIRRVRRGIAKQLVDDPFARDDLVRA